MRKATAAAISAAMAVGTSFVMYGSTSSIAGAKSKTINIGMDVPLTGPLASTGLEQKVGAELAVQEINKAGGIKSLGHAKLKLIVKDSGSITESQAVTSATSLVTSDHIVAGIGTGISSPTVAVTAYAQSAHVPWLTVAFTTVLTSRHFKPNYIFAASPGTVALSDAYYPAVNEIAKAAGVKLTKIAVTTTTNSTSENSANLIVNTFAPKFGWTIVFHKVYHGGTITPAVANGIVSQWKADGAQAVFVGITPPDDANLQKAEIAQGMKPLPWIFYGAPYISKTLENAFGGAKAVEGVMTVGTAGVYKADKKIAKIIRKHGDTANEYNLVPWSEVHVIAEALTKAKSTTSSKLRKAIAKFNTKGGLAGSVYPCDCEKFKPTGRTATNIPQVIEWLTGVPTTVYPAKYAQAKPYFAKP